METTKNLFEITPFHMQDRNINHLSDEIINGATAVFEMRGFNAQCFDNCDSVNIFYISKYKKIFTQKQLRDFCEKHPEETFIIIPNDDGNEYSIWVKINSSPNKLLLNFYKVNNNGILTFIASIKNVPQTVQWDERSIYYNKEFVDNITKESYRYYGSMSYNITLNNIKDSHRIVQNTFSIIGEGNDLNTTAIMNQYLEIPNKTRIVSYVGYYNIQQKISITGDRILSDDLSLRYGITPRNEDEDNHSYSYHHIHCDEQFNAGIDKNTWNRIEEYLKMIVRGPKAKTEELGERYYSYRHCNAKTAAIIVISEPAGQHRRPTYHYVKAFYVNNAIDVVELARGELLMKDMTPVDCYYLYYTGEYVRISHNTFSSIKNTIMNTDIDKVTLAEWSETKALHPTLVKAAAAVEDKVGLSTIKLFNRVPFGSLYLEQLIKGQSYDIAKAMADYIVQRGDNMNYVCSSLKDIFPGCNPEGTSLLAIMNMTKPCFELLSEFKTGVLERYLIAYKAIKTFMPDGILTKDGKQMVMKYMELVSMNWHQYHCRTGRTVDIINYPNEIKSVYKMIDRFKNNFKDSYDMLRSYKEIVMAYFQFKDFGWDPAQYQIFIEFGLGDLSQTAQMVRDREHAANTALKIYQNKIDEEAHKIVEKQYSNRKSTIEKMMITKTMVKESKTGLLNKYTIIVPSQIYGEEVINSIEKEGHDLNHCVYRSYANEIASGSYTVLYLRSAVHPDDPMVTIGINADGRINQTYRLDDQGITPEQAQAIAEWATLRKGMVTFRTEGNDVPPGGWPKSVEVPTLPKPDAEWLKKLGSIE